MPGLSTFIRYARNYNPTAATTLVAPSYRGYWKSSGSPSQKGLEADASALIQWLEQYGAQHKVTKYILWGQSLGASVALSAALFAGLKQMAIHAVVLETPFTAIKDVMAEIYSAKYLPYRHLHPFLISTWDTLAMLNKLANCSAMQFKPNLLVVQAGKV